MKTVTLPEAQRLLPSLAQAVMEGERVMITLGGGGSIVLHQAHEEELIPMREEGYFDDSLDDESIKEDNMAAMHSPQTWVP